MRATVTAHELTTLRRYADRNGRSWKACLRADWETACADIHDLNERATLQTLRNASSFGPSGLLGFTFKSANVVELSERR